RPDGAHRLRGRQGLGVAPPYGAGARGLRPCSPGFARTMFGTEVNTMYSRILFAVDDDEALPAAERVVGAWAQRWDADVRVLHVHRMDPGVPDAAGRRLGSSVGERLPAAGAGAAGGVRLGQPGGNGGPGV